MVQIANELYNGNQSMIIVQMKYGDTSQEALFLARDLQEMLETEIAGDGYTLSVLTTGFLVETAKGSLAILDDLPLQLLLAIILLSLFLWYQLKSFTVPLRLETTIILGTTYALGLGTILWFIFTGEALNLVINVTSVITLLGLGTDFDIFLSSIIGFSLSDQWVINIFGKHSQYFTSFIDNHLKNSRLLVQC